MAQHRKKIYFKEEDILLASEIYKGIKNMKGFVSVLQDRESNTYSCIIINNPNHGFLELLLEQKRDSDIVQVISKKRGLFYVIAQETSERDATKFLKRIYKLAKSKLNNNNDPFSVITSIKDNSHNSEYLMFKLIQEYMFYMKQEARYRIDGISSTTI